MEPLNQLLLALITNDTIPLILRDLSVENAYSFLCCTKSLHSRMEKLTHGSKHHEYLSHPKLETLKRVLKNWCLFPELTLELLIRMAKIIRKSTPVSLVKMKGNLAFMKKHFSCQWLSYRRYHDHIYLLDFELVLFQRGKTVYDFEVDVALGNSTAYIYMQQEAKGVKVVAKTSLNPKDYRLYVQKGFGRMPLSARKDWIPNLLESLELNSKAPMALNAYPPWFLPLYALRELYFLPNVIIPKPKIKKVDPLQAAFELLLRTQYNSGGL